MNVEKRGKLVEYCNWILAFHIMNFASWMAVLFYLPKFFIYYVEYKSDGKVFAGVIEIQERKLYRFIGQPAFSHFFMLACSYKFK